MLGTTIGASALDPKGDAYPLTGFDSGTGVSMTGKTLITILAGTYITGCSPPSQGALHGVLTWAATTLATVRLLASLAADLARAAARKRNCPRPGRH